MTAPLTSPGLLDLQVNGYAGVDFNNAALTADALDAALEAMLASGVTACLPTLITASFTTLRERFLALDAAVASSRLGPSMVPGYHLEGPFLNSGDGYAGCHPASDMCDPDAGFVERLAAGLRRPILLVTLAPERSGAVPFIQAMRVAGRIVAVAHSAANFSQIQAAVAAGMTLSTHLGNGLPHVLPKLENTLLAQLAEAGLTACFIGDGHHLPRQPLAAMIRLKGHGRSILVTDAVTAAAAPPGRYDFAGITVERDSAGLVRRPGDPYLAGSGLSLDEAVRNVVDWGVAEPATAIAMAADNPRSALAPALLAHGIRLTPGRVSWSSDLRPTLEAPGSVDTVERVAPA